jgi:hypothetical protein
MPASIALNQTAPPEAVADLKIDRFADLPSDGRCVRDLCF